MLPSKCKSGQKAKTGTIGREDGPACGGLRQAAQAELVRALSVAMPLGVALSLVYITCTDWAPGYADAAPPESTGWQNVPFWMDSSLNALVESWTLSSQVPLLPPYLCPIGFVETGKANDFVRGGFVF